MGVWLWMHVCICLCLRIKRVLVRGNKRVMTDFESRSNVSGRKVMFLCCRERKCVECSRSEWTVVGGYFYCSHQFLGWPFHLCSMNFCLPTVFFFLFPWSEASSFLHPALFLAGTQGVVWHVASHLQKFITQTCILPDFYSIDQHSIGSILYFDIAKSARHPGQIRENCQTWWWQVAGVEGSLNTREREIDQSWTKNGWS